MMTEIQNKDDLIRYVERSGSHFFDRDTMHFFRSRLLEEIHRKGDKVYFVTSEQFSYLDRTDPRRYTIRVLNLESDARVDITEIGGFQQYATRAQAIGALRRYLKTLA